RSMADFWYYSHDQEKFGPCSGRRMKELAACGGILPTDTVWKEGVERGVPASKVKNLFTPAPAGPPDEVPAAATPAASPPAVAQAPAPPPRADEPKPTERRAEPAPPEPAAGSSSRQPARKGRATAGRGAVIVSQDGVNVKFRKKCTTCGHLDPSWN